MGYGEGMERKKLVVATILGALALVAGAAWFEKSKPIAPLKVVAAPTIGKDTASVEVVLIEDFQCRNCRAFARNIIPRLQAEYVRSGQIRFTLVPVSFLAGSQAIANGALEVYKQNPAKFFPYLKEILNYEGEVTTNDLIRMARRLGGIDLGRLQTCIEKGCHQEELNRNLHWAHSVMGTQFRTPAIYINGAPGSTFSFEAIQYQIDKTLGKP